MSIDMWGLGESGSAIGSDSGVFNNTTSVSDPTLSCAARNIQGPIDLPYSTTLLTTVRAIQSLFLIILFLSGSSLNILVIVLVAKYKKLQTLSFGIALQVVAVDLVLCATSLIRLTNAIANRWVFGEHVCFLVGMYMLVITLVRVAIMLVFVIDRFLAVFCPFAYPKYQMKIIIILSVMSWLLVFIPCIIGYVLDCFTFSHFSWLCSTNSSCNNKCSIFLGLLLTTFTAPATITPIFLFSSKPRRQKRQ